MGVSSLGCNALACDVVDYQERCPADQRGSESWAKHTWPTKFVGKRPSETAKQEQSLSAYLNKRSACFCLMVFIVLSRCMKPALYGFFLSRPQRAGLVPIINAQRAKSFADVWGKNSVWGI